MFWLESVANALEQAKQAASLIAGRDPPAPEVTWNWSDQYDLKLLCLAGLPFDADSILVRGDPDQATSAVFHLKGDVIQSLEAVNAPAEFMGGYQLNGQQGGRYRVCGLANTSISMKEVAAQQARCGGVHGEDHLHRARRGPSMCSTSSPACRSWRGR